MLFYKELIMITEQIDKDIYELCLSSDKELKDIYKRIDEIALKTPKERTCILRMSAITGTALSAAIRLPT